MQLSRLHEISDLVVSFELFPPKNAEAEVKLFEQTIPEMLELDPAFMTCTYGAGGSTQGQTLEIVRRLKNEVGIEAATHLTCVGASRADLAKVLETSRADGITNILALRGDPPAKDPNFRPHPDGFKLAVELVRFIKNFSDFDVVVAGYPEGHPECPDKYLDWQRCAEKVAAGADIIITQLFYDNHDFFEFEDYLKNRLGVNIPIVPGVLPILNTQQIRRFCGMCGASLPPPVMRKLEELANDNSACRQYGIDLATQMCDELIRHGVPGIHFYTLNRTGSTRAVMQNLGLCCGRPGAAD